MKEIRVKFQESEYDRIKAEADRLGISIKEYVHIRAMGVSPGDTPMCAAKMFCEEVGKYREALNQIIQREILAGTGLYEDDVIRMELTMSAIENTVADFIKNQLRVVKKSGNTDFYSN